MWAYGARERDLPKWRKRKHTVKKVSYDIEWCYKKLECGYYVVLVKWGGLIGSSYCAPDDALPHWNPQTSIDLAFARRKIRDDINFSYSPDISDYIAVEYAVLGGFVPHKVIAEVRKTNPNIHINM